MIPPAQQYNWRFLWLQCDRTLDSSTGDLPRSYVGVGYLWGGIINDSANEAEELGTLRSSTTATIRLRGFPSVSASDRLYWYRFETTYIIDGVRTDFVKNETILDVHSYVDGVTY